LGSASSSNLYASLSSRKEAPLPRNTCPSFIPGTLPFQSSSLNPNPFFLYPLTSGSRRILPPFLDSDQS
jgi:hypothetical protein